MRDWLETLESHGTEPAIVDDTQTLLYSDLVDGIRVAAERFADAGVVAGDTVVLHSDYSMAGICAFFALARLRAVVAPITHLTAGAIDVMRESGGARFICRTVEPLVEMISDCGPEPELCKRLRDGGAAGVIVLSSGSTGRPKAILHNLDTLFHEKASRGSVRKSTILLFLMFDHLGGINTLIHTLFSGGTAVITPQRTPEAVCRSIARHRVQIFPTNPTFLNLILIGGFHERFDLSSLKLITYGTEPMPEQLLKRLHAAFPRVRLLQTFGTSETGAAATRSASSESIRFKISDVGYEHRVVDGELQLRSRTQFLGYLNCPNTAETDDGWFRTGDLAQLDADGYLTILGHASDIINVGGEKVFPLEIESVLLEHPLVADCVVYGEPNAITGKTVCADIRPSREIERSDLRREIQAFLASRVERFKVPSRIKLVAVIEASERFKKRRSRA